MAVQILDTPKPSINLSASSIIKALTTNKNKPNVRIVIGKVNIINSGFTNTFKTARTTATINGVVKESSSDTPGKNLAIIITAKAVRISLIIVFIRKILSLKLQIIQLVNKLNYTIVKSCWVFGMKPMTSIFYGFDGGVWKLHFY